MTKAEMCAKCAARLFARVWREVRAERDRALVQAVRRREFRLTPVGGLTKEEEREQ